MNGDPADVLSHDLHLADMDAGPDLQAVPARRVAESPRRNAAPAPGPSNVASNPSPVVFTSRPP